MKIDEKTKKELIDEVVAIIAHASFCETYWDKGTANKIVSYVLEKLNVEIVSEAEMHSEQN